MNTPGNSSIFRHSPGCFFLSLSFSLSIFGMAGGLEAQTWKNTALSPAQRATALISAMTEAEQIAMLTGTPNNYIGSIPANSRLGIPSLNFEDGPDGVGDSQGGVTAFPSSVCLSATWDTNMARQYGIAMGQEEWGKGGQGFLGPTMNMARLYNDGRDTENYGEDPFLSSAMAVSHIQGIQSQGIMVTAKHFVCNDQETDRFLVSADVDERTRQEIYYQPFLACVRGGASGIMSSYNRINDTYACENPILNAVVKKLWGFDGFIMSDYAAYYSTVGAANDGLDLDMLNGALSSTPLSNQIANGNVPMAEVSDMAYRILETMFRFGNFDNPSPGNFNATVTTAAHALFARQCAAAGTVLLQNSNNLLPLNTNTIKSIAVIGAAASTTPISVAYGSSEVTLPYNITPLAGIQSRATNITVNYSVGDNAIPAAVALAKSSDVAIVCVGQQTGESLDRTSLSLPGDEDALISAVAAANPHTIVVLYCSSATLMPWYSNIAASLVAWFPGQENGNALAEVLFGDVNPSGKLPCSFPASASQEPLQTTAQFPGIGGHISYSEGLDIGYRWYDASGIAPLFPFGHGLSYTTFGYTNLSVSSVSASGQVQVSFTLSNTGSIAGAEVPQLYLGFPSAAGEPPKILKGFQKITLQPGQSQQVTFNLDWEDLANWDQVRHGWLVTPGTFQVMVGASAGDLRLTGSFNVSSVPSSDLADAALHGVAPPPRLPPAAIPPPRPWMGIRQPPGIPPRGIRNGSWWILA